ncbi:MAG TPA: SMI1/KNR4 family protein [Abditibacteriaceae bacterium]|jgi:hypothetical protein
MSASNSIASKFKEFVKIPPFPLMRPDEVDNAEKLLGFELPATLKLIYTEVGNGGFGPGYGFFGLMGGMAGGYRSQSAVEQYLEYCKHKAPNSDVWSQENPEWFWLKGLLPICEWGCGITSSVHCLLSGFPVVIADNE